MGEFFDYIAASDAELAAVYPTIARYELTSVIREATNPFTGESMGPKNVWVPASATGTPLSDEPALDPQIHELTIKRLDPVTFFGLCKAADPSLNISIDQFLYPDLKASHPDPAEVYQLPRQSTLALAAVDDARAVSQVWSKTEEAQLLQWEFDDFLSVTQQFVKLARTATGTSRNIYCIMPDLTEPPSSKPAWWKFW